MTAVCWSATAVFFTFAGRRVGSVVVNRTRLVMALVLISLTHWILMGSPFPGSAEPQRWFWLGLSGVIGLALGDAFLFQAYLWVGPRLGMLMMSLAPVIAALLAFAFLGEQLLFVQWLGISVTLAGIALVVLEGNRGARPAPQKRDYRRGILFGIGAASGQAIGLVLAKQGLQGDFSALSGNWIRMASAVVALWGVTLLSGRAGPTVRKLADDRHALLPILGGAITGPFIGVLAVPDCCPTHAGGRGQHLDRAASRLHASDRGDRVQREGWTGSHRRNGGGDGRGRSPVLGLVEAQ